MKNVHVNGFLICSTMAEADFVSTILPEHVRLTRAEPGCRKFEVFRSNEDPFRFALSETFDNKSAFEAHQARTRASDWWEKTKHIERDFKIDGIG